MGKWAWFRKNWFIINVAYGVALALAALIVKGGTVQGNVDPPFVVFFGILWLSLGLDGISSGEIMGAQTIHADKNPVSFWLAVTSVLSLGCVFFIVGIRNLWRGW